MCGIVGYVRFDDKKADSEMLQKMARCLQHRGPDDNGIYTTGNIGFGHTRLSILDTTTLGHQPMISGEYVIVFNGEIYNFPELRKTLQSKGYNFCSHSDTEVILKGFEEWNTELFKKLNGIFSFAI